MEQRSEEWYKFRSKHIGASDVPVIFGLSPYRTELDLFLEKVLCYKNNSPSFAAQRGIDAEPKIKALYEAKFGVTVTSPTLEYPAWPILSASLDGVHNSIVAEFKYPGKALHEKAKRGKVPDLYMPQLQAQLLVTGYKLAHYVSFDGLGIEVINVKPNKRMQEKILNECKEFWKKVEDMKSRLSFKGGELEWIA